MTEESIFNSALAIADPAARAAYLDRACEAHPDLRRQVEELLAAHAGRHLLDRPPVELARTGAYVPAEEDAQSTVSVGDRIGPYKLLERIGEGGMGEVWVADQLEPIKRRVALKLIKPGMDSRGVLARFEAERQALAVMDHPNIAKVLDAGTTKGEPGGVSPGRPYFVMELVKGTPITEFADARKLSPKERLELFVPVCQAIQHAHMKGLIHRDIKPSNVLVELHDDKPVVKVIDFGVAKAIGQQLTEKTIYTGLGALVGTPAYMAPEQATFNALDVDTRADVYALGVLLYELLAGSPPIEAERLKKAALDEVLRLVRDEEPPRPSQRLSTSQAKASIAATRGSEPAKLSTLMKGEIDWIVMKALEKERSRRYDTATALAKDVQRYLSGDAVEACPPTLGYRLRKAYRRNRAAVLVGSAFIGLIAGAAVVGALLAVQARRAEAMAREKEQEAQRNMKAYSEVSERYADAAAEAEIRGTSARLDADLLEYKSDARVGLLRLARPLKDYITLPLTGPNFTGTTQIDYGDNPEFIKLREFQAAAVIAAGQEFVPLVPPLEGYHNHSQQSPDGRLFLSDTDHGGLVLFSIPSLKRVGLLREKDERVLQFGFSPDGKTIWTQDVDSIVRFWNPDGTFRAKTPLRPERFIYPAGLTARQVREVADLGNRVIVADGVAAVWSQPPARGKLGKGIGDWYGSSTNVPSPRDLYSTRTGQFIRRLGRSSQDWPHVQIAASDRWMIYQDERRDAAGPKGIDLVIVSAADGRELARLEHPNAKRLHCVEVSPTGKYVLTACDGEMRIDGQVIKSQVRLWSHATWKPVDDDTLRPLKAMLESYISVSFVTDDVVSLGMDATDSSHLGILQLHRPWFYARGASIGAIAPKYDKVFSCFGGTVINCGRALTDASTFQRLNPVPGRRYAPELAKLAPDGRFFENLDTATEKELPYSFEGKHFPGMGRVGIRTYGEGAEENPRYYDDAELRILPDPTRLSFPPAMLELWARVVTGGELDEAGRFVPWDEPTWAAKQKQLAAMKPPYADFPFPGWAATEPHLWCRIRANELKESRERDRLINEWRRRCGRVRSKPEPDTWRTPGPDKPEPKK